MAEENKEIKTITPVKVQERSVAKDLAKYAMDEYIKPKTNDVLHDLFAGVVEMFGDAIKGSIDKLFYGEDKSRNRVKNNNVVRTFNQDIPYHVYSISPTSTYQRPQRPNNSQRSGRSVKLIYFDTKEKARQAIDELRNEIKDYGNVKVGKLYEIIREPTSPEDWKYGWNDINDINYVEEYVDGRRLYKLSLAEPINVLSNASSK